jgi:hypothetical protein
MRGQVTKYSQLLGHPDYLIPAGTNFARCIDFS